MLGRILPWFSTLGDLGRLYVMSRRPHIEEELPTRLAPGPWVVIATQRPLQPGEPTYGTPAYRAVEPGERFWIFVEPGEYWLYAVAGEEPQAAMRAFYADPDAATPLGAPVESAPGFRESGVLST